MPQEKQFTDWGFAPKVDYRRKKAPTTPKKSDKQVMKAAITERSERIARNVATDADNKRTGRGMFDTGSVKAGRKDR